MNFYEVRVDAGKESELFMIQTEESAGVAISLAYEKMDVCFDEEIEVTCNKKLPVDKITVLSDEKPLVIMAEEDYEDLIKKAKEAEEDYKKARKDGAFYLS